VLVVPGGNRGADHHAVKTQIPGQRLGGEARERFRISGPQAIVVDIAARMASRDGRAPSDSTNFRNSDLPPRSRNGLPSGSGNRLWLRIGAARARI
jgi:hypothetical protein